MRCAHRTNRLVGGISGLMGLLAMLFVVLPVLPAHGESLVASTRQPTSKTKQQAPASAAIHSIQRSIHRSVPIVFVANRGQSPAGTLYEARTGGLQVMLEETGVTLRVERPNAAAAVAAPKPAASPAGAGPSDSKIPKSFTVEQQTIQFVGANPDVTVEPLDEQTSKVNYFIGNDPNRWVRNLKTYARVRYHNLYPGIDMVFYSHNGQLEYDFVVAAGADPSQIRLRIDGSDPMQVTTQGELQIGGRKDAVLHRPLLYQNLKNGKKMVEGKFVRVAANTVGFQFANYDKTKTFIIDPTINLVYSTYAGGIHDDEAWGMTLDAAGNTYLTGSAASQDFPVTANALQTTEGGLGGSFRVIVMKFDPSGTLLYSTFLGGATSNDIGYAIVADAAGNAYVGGYTISPDFPVTPGAFQSAPGGGNDAFLAKISSDGSQLLYSTYLGGSGDEYIGSLLLNADGSLWMAGGASAAGLPASANATQSKPNGKDNYFVAKAVFNQSGVMQIPYLTFLGGSNQTEEAFWGSLATDSTGNVYLAGGTQSSDFPATANALQQSIPLSGGCGNSPTPNSAPFVSKFSPDLSKLLYSSEIGGKTEATNGYPDCNNFALSIHLDAQGNIWTVGTVGDSDLPVTPNAISKQLNGNNTAGVDYAISELSADGSKLLYSSYLGGSQFDYGARAAWDANNNIWITGTTQSTDFPVTPDALQSANAGGYDIAVTELSPDATKVLYSTYLGGSGDDGINGNGSVAVDTSGNVHLAGETASTNFPVTPDALQPLFANGDQGPNGADVFYTVLGTGAIGTVGPLVGGNTGDTTLTVSGAGFQQGATCSLVQDGTTIASTQATVNSSGTSISCTLALNGATTGSYDVVVNNPDGSSLTKKGGFTVQSGGQPNIWANIISRPKIRTNVQATLLVTYGNSGNVDAYDVPITLQLPATFTLDIPAAQSSTVVPSDLSYTDNTDGSEYIQFVAPHLAPGESVALPFQITDATDGDIWYVGVTAGDAAYSSLQDAQSGLTSLKRDGIHALSSPNPQDPLEQGAQNFASTVSGAFTDMGQQEGFTYDATQATTAFTQYYAAAMADSINQTVSTPPQARDIDIHPNLGVNVTCCADIGVTPNGGQSAPINFTYNGLPSVTTIPAVGNNPLVKNPIVGPLVQQVIGKLQDAITGQVFNSPKNICAVHGGAYTGHYKKSCGACNSGIQICQNSYGCNIADSTQIVQGLPYPVNCNPQNPKPCPGKGKVKGNCTPPNGTGGSVDPNYKAGPAGDGSASQYVSGTVPLAYNVGFENEPTATLPAANVVVTDQLDPTKVDLSTLSLGTISFGTNVINLPNGSTNYNTTYNLNSSLSVRIQGSLDSSTGLLKWTFTSIDPSTGQPPTDPTIGFLPPDTDGIVGQGSVLFNVMPKAGQTTGTQVTNMATVVFDANAPINTKTWMNTLDVDAPVSAVAALPATQVAPSGTVAFTVNWSGTDKGSGIASYTVYVSDNGGAFTAWQSGVTTTSASYTGTAGHTYGFYSIATDGAGNVEAAKAKADTTTQILTSAPPDFTLAATASSLSIAPGGSGMVTVNVTPVNGFNAAVSFACSGLPSETTCSFSPATVTPSGAAASTTTLTITTTAPTSSRNSIPWPFAGGGVTLAFGLFFLGKKKRLPSVVCLVLLLGIGAVVVGCGSSSKSGGGGTGNPGTPAGTSTVTVTATAGSGSSAISHTTTISLTVQ